MNRENKFIVKIIKARIKSMQKDSCTSDCADNMNDRISELKHILWLIDNPEMANVLVKSVGELNNE